MNSTFKGYKSRNNNSIINYKEVLSYENSFKNQKNQKKFITFAGCESYNEKDHEKFLRETPHFKENKNNFEVEKKQIQKKNIVKTILQKKNSTNNLFKNEKNDYNKYYLNNDLIEKIEFLIKNIPNESYSDSFIKEKVGNIIQNINEIENYIIKKKKNKKKFFVRNQSDIFKKNTLIKLERSKFEESYNRNSLSLNKYKEINNNTQNIKKNNEAITERTIKKQNQI